MVALRAYLGDVQANAGDACVLMVYIPTKAHIYFPYVTSLEDQTAVLDNARRVDLGEEGRIVQYEISTTHEVFISRLDSMSIGIGNVAREMGLHFVDLTPPLKEAAARGEEAFYVYDTHFNQLGHDMAGEAVSEYIRGHRGCGT
jgi:hypothetical protein